MTRSKSRKATEAAVGALHEAIWKVKERARALEEGGLRWPLEMEAWADDELSNIAGGFGQELSALERLMEGYDRLRKGEV